MPVVRIDISVFWVVHFAFVAPVVVFWDLGGGALVLGVALVAPVEKCLSAFLLSIQLLVFGVFVADREMLIPLLCEALVG